MPNFMPLAFIVPKIIGCDKKTARPWTLIIKVLFYYFGTKPYKAVRALYWIYYVSSIFSRAAFLNLDSCFSKRIV